MFECFHCFSFIAFTLCLTFIAIIVHYIRRCQTRLDIQKNTRDVNNDCLSLMVVLGSGGHTSEMMSLLSGLKMGSIDGKYSPITFIASNDDLLSERKVKQLMESLSDCQLLSIRRSRSVGQSYWTSIVTTIISLMESLVIIYKVSPQVIVCNGPGVCVPICLSAKLLLRRVTIVFIESFCRTDSLSLSAKLLYYCRSVDHLLVQWPQLTRQYPRTKYIGLLV